MKHGRSAVRASVGGGFEGTLDRLQRSVLKKGFQVLGLRKRVRRIFRRHHRLSLEVLPCTGPYCICGVNP